MTGTGWSGAAVRGPVCNRASYPVAQSASGLAPTPAALPGVWVFTPPLHHDDRGSFQEIFTAAGLRDAAGLPLPLAQANCSISAAGVLRGLHSAQVPPGQPKYVTCVRGAAYDVAVDLRIGSPTFGHWSAVLLDDERRQAVYLPEGIGHGYLALAKETTMIYLCAEPYRPAREFDVDPLDPAIGIDWPTTDRDGRPLVYQQSDKDRRAPSLAEARAAGWLPTVDDCPSWPRVRPAAADTGHPVGRPEAAGA